MRRAPHHGFTLLETLMAVAILALVISSIYRTWDTALSGWKRAMDVSDAFQRQRVVLDALSELTKSAVFVNTEAGVYEVIGRTDPTTGSSISFITASDALLPASEASLGGLRRVTIALLRDIERGSYLAIQNQPALIEEEDKKSEAPWHVLSDSVSGFWVRYRSPLDGNWNDTWEEESFIPAAVEYTIVFGQPNSRTPPVVITRAVELPAAQFALLAIGARMDQSNTTNEITRPEIDLSKLGLGDVGGSGR